ncbi:hypothetical protein KP509_29G076300 [Ceratopteris richardii]|uniref:mRNA-decapping enzyme-like protein n=1 Tax=Ceratopteris richardii TaxID=49495 RepID=A0A8T2R9X0_CERRI|nr:hypothetical protein KP509_29G076300 [Ceratopteris richardii]
MRERETQGGQNGRLINQQRTWELNLTVLQRLDEHIQEILFTAAHVTLYDFDVDKCQWSRKGVEGSLFVVKRRNKPRFQFIVMNRRSTTNLVEDVLDGFECEVQVPYLLYRNAADEVNGIWFYNSRECEEVGSLLARISNAYSKAPSKQTLSPPRNDFSELEIPTSSVVEEPLEPPSASAATPTAPKDSLERFFSDVLNLNSHQPTSSIMRSAANMHTSSSHAPDLPMKYSHPSVDLTTKYSTGHAVPSPPPPPPLPPPSNPLVRDTSNPSSEALLKPYFYVPPPLPAAQSSSLHHPVLQPSVGAPLLQPFPPPTSFALGSSSNTSSFMLTSSNTSSVRPIISKESVRDALFRLVQNDAFIDMAYEELLRAHR